MHIPAWPVLPDSTLAPGAVLQKFRVSSLAGLGCGCSQTDDTGTCLDPDPCPPPPSSAGCPGSPGCPGYIDPNVNAAIQAAIPTQPDTTVQTSSGTVVAGYTVPSQSSTAWANVAAALVKGGMTLAQIQSIQPGTVVSANGAILRQSPGFSVPVTSSTTNLGLSASGSSGLLIAAAVGLAVVVMMSGRRN
jgi:hypothetical protein